jgi:L-asparagine transporter-like permease
MNTSIYLGSRMLFSLARGGYAPRAFGELNAQHVPMRATIVTGIGILAAASLSILTPLAYNYLFGIVLFGGLLVWGAILVSHLRFRRKHDAADLPVRMPFFPYAQILGLILLGAIAVTMAIDADWQVAVLAGGPWLIFIVAAYFVWRRVAAGSARTS